MSKTKSRKTDIKWRTIISLTTAWMFVIMGITGLILYIVPQGRIAYWVDWRFLGLSKTDWGDIHIVTAILFLVAGGWHLYYNWRAFLGHLRRRAAQGVKLRKELLITVAITVFIAMSAFWHVPPLGYLIDLNEAIKDSWAQTENAEPPFGHAELLSLKGFCKKTDIDVEQALAKLAAMKIKLKSSDETLEQIARRNSISPRDIFGTIKDLRKKKISETREGRKLTVDDVFERFDGTGVGKKTVSEACAMGGEKVSRCLLRLEHQGFDADPNDTLKIVANRGSVRPIQILQTMLVDR